MRRKCLNYTAANEALTKEIVSLKQEHDQDTMKMTALETRIADLEGQTQTLTVEIQNAKAEKEAASQDLAQFKKVKTEEDTALAKLQEYQKWMSSMPNPI